MSISELKHVSKVEDPIRRLEIFTGRRSSTLVERWREGGDSSLRATRAPTRSALWRAGMA